ncbi:MAG: hypothetical protein ACI9BW_001144 [Gammaproteobacteria bacterium]|jgi:hypothetical protein
MSCFSYLNLDLPPPVANNRQETRPSAAMVVNGLFYFLGDIGIEPLTPAGRTRDHTGCGQDATD